MHQTDHSQSCTSQTCTSQTRNSMDEYHSKALLKKYGIPTVSETIIAHESQLGQAARETGFPVVLKALGKTLAHKSELGLVHLNLGSEKDVAKAARQIAQSAGKDLEGFLIQPMVKGQREFVAGLIRDPQFGPCVMFGLGGVFTEALKDTTCRVAPLTRHDAREMLREIRTTALLGNFRGQKPVDETLLIDTLTGLSKIGMENPGIAEIDINPLVATADGNLVAVDGLVVMDDTIPAPATKPAVPPERLLKMISPNTVALIGASGTPGKWGERLMSNILKNDFQGVLHLVNPKGEDIFERPVYKSVEDIPGEVDMAIVAIPAVLVLDLLPKLGRKKIKQVVLVTSGFGETGQTGKSLEKELVVQAQKEGILILGPNTMGICNPHLNFLGIGSVMEINRPGETALVAQSGNMGAQFLGFARLENIGVRCFCGSGNEAMISMEDYITALGTCDLTRTIIVYMESIANGRRFLEAARNTSLKKPILMIKGGRSKSGNQAAASHTGALSSDTHIFKGACQQAGIVRLDTPADLMDTAAAFSSLPLPRGNRVAVLTLGGGWGVVAADLCSDYGLELAELPESLIRQFDELLPDFWSRSNPLDIVGEADRTLPFKILESLIRWEGCDGVISLGLTGRAYAGLEGAKARKKINPDFSEGSIADIEAGIAAQEGRAISHIISLMAEHHKPVFGVSLMKNPGDDTIFEEKGKPYKGLLFKTPEQAVKSFAHMWAYQQFKIRAAENLPG